MFGYVTRRGKDAVQPPDHAHMLARGTTGLLPQPHHPDEGARVGNAGCLPPTPAVNVTVSDPLITVQ